jgi:flagellar motor switch protein FliM
MMDSEEKRLRPRSVPRPTEYEACAPGALPSEQMALVHAIQEKFLDAFALALAARLETRVTAHLVAAQPLDRSVFQQSGEDGGCLFTLDAEPVRSQALVEFSAGLVAYLLRVLLCTPPSSADSPRAVTDIERHILHEIFESLAHELTAAWKAAGIAFRCRSTGAREAIAGQDTMLVFECHLALDDAQEIFRIAVPALLARIAALQSASAAVEETPAPVREMIFGALRRGNVSVEAVLPNSTLRMRDLLAMEPGHVLLVAQAAGSPVECRIGGKPKFRGDWIRHANRHALVLL